jgi:hypothetical protein
MTFPSKEHPPQTDRDHLHCPAGCEHPQPFCCGELILCGLCFYWHDQVTPMEPCTEKNCA